MAFGISRKVGSAVTRNRLRRQMWHHLLERARSGRGLPSGAYLVSVQPGASVEELLADLDGALDTVGSRS